MEIFSEALRKECCCFFDRESRHFRSRWKPSLSHNSSHPFASSGCAADEGEDASASSAGRKSSTSVGGCVSTLAPSTTAAAAAATMSSPAAAVGGGHKWHAINVIVTPTAASKLSSQDLVHWVNETLHTDTVFKVQDLGSGEYYCLLMNQLFQPREPVQWKKIRFNSKSETDHITNWRAFQAGLKAVGIDKEIPIDRLVAKKPGDNVEFAQWFYKFYVTNKSHNEMKSDAAGLSPEGGSAGGTHYDPVEERHRRGIHLEPSGSSSGVKARNSLNSRLTRPKPSSSLAPKRVSRAPSPSAPRLPPAAEAVTPNKAEEEAVHTEQVAHMQLQIKNLQETLRFLEKERDFYFGKLRDIEIMCQDQPFGNSLPINEVITVLYSTEEGFTSPEPESGCSSPLGAI